MVQLSADAPNILRRLQQEGIDNFYHFTSITNLPNILKYNGLCSKQLQESKGDWPCPDPGGNDLSHNLDKACGNWNCIGLNLTSHTPMVYNKKQELHLCFFIIHPEVATGEGVIFTDTNAASKNHRRGTGLAGLELINFNTVKSPIKPSDPDWKIYVQAEILVPEKIPLDMVKKIVFVSEASKKEGERLWDSASHPPFEIDKTLFQDYPNRLDPSTGFSFVHKVVLTDNVVDKNNVNQIQTHQQVFKRKSKGVITAVVTVQAMAGAKGKFIWGAGNKESETEFETSSAYYWWPSISLDDIFDGYFHLEVQLNSIMWSTLEYEVSS